MPQGQFGTRLQGGKDRGLEDLRLVLGEVTVVDIGKKHQIQKDLVDFTVMRPFPAEMK